MKFPGGDRPHRYSVQQEPDGTWSVIDIQHGDKRVRKNLTARNALTACRELETVWQSGGGH